MTNSPNEPNGEVQIESDLYTSPLRGLAYELHEIYTELKAVGFPEKATVQIVAHMASDMIFSQEIEINDEDDEDDDDEEGDTLDDGAAE